MAEVSTAASLGLTYTIDGLSGDYSPSAFPEKSEFEPSSFTDYLQLFGFLLILAIFLCGLVGNATVIYYLCFILTKNPITTYILNLAVADSCVLLSLALSILAGILHIGENSSELCLLLFISTHTTSLYLLTAISIEKCLSVVFPIWYRCHRPEHLSTIVSALIWVMSSLVFGIHCFFIFITEGAVILFHVIHVINSVFCPLVVVICTVILFIKVCCSLHRRQRGKFYTALLLALLFFLIFGVPLSAVINLGYLYVHFQIIAILATLCAVINSSVNPFIYFLIGRKKTRQRREPLKVVFERVFSDKADCRGGEGLPTIVDSMMMTP